MEKPYDVVVVGELNVDLILNRIDKFPEIGKEVLANHMTLTLGSSSAIFASNLSTLGASVTFIGKIGHDDFGNHIVTSLRSKGVDTDNIVYTKEHSTGATIVLNFDEDRANVTYPGAMDHLTSEDVSDGTLLRSRHLHISSIFMQQGLKKDVAQLLKRAKKLGLTTSVDPQWDPAEKWDIDLRELLLYTDVFLPNAAELKALTGESDLNKAWDALPKASGIIVVKNGSDGAYCRNGKDILYQPAFLNKQVVDSIGAGDSFDAGFIRQFLLKKTWKECLEFAALTGAVNTTRSGGTGAFENISAVRTIAQSTFNYTF